jgi:sucrose-6-phosphate hydrolase SacC (GH32 family)
VQENLGYINRDPKAIWYEPDKQWVIVLYLDQGAFVFFTSEDLKVWQKQSRLTIEELGINEIAAFEDCPELFELPVNGNNKNKKWILYAGSGDYVIGDFNGKRFIPESKLIKFNYGNAFYASQTFNNLPESDSRRIQIAWGLTPTHGMPFNQSLLFPVELTLRTTDEGLRMFAYPVDEIDGIIVKEHIWKDLFLSPRMNLLSDIDAELLDIDAEFIIDQNEEFGIRIKGKIIKYNPETQILRCGNQEINFKPSDGTLKMRILVDRLTIELFVNDGQIYMPIRAYPEDHRSDLMILTTSDVIGLKSVVVKELKSVWN